MIRYLYEGQWAALGVFLGGLSQSLQAIYAAYGDVETPVPISAGDLILIVICGMSAIAFIILKFFINKNENSADKLLEKFRNRSKQKVAGTDNQDT